MKHVLPLTYQPKVQQVIRGEITRTIRPLKKRIIRPGDEILFHGWSGVPYRSKWSWRLRVTVEKVEQIKIDVEKGIFRKGEWYGWSSIEAQRVAISDGFRTPGGEYWRATMDFAALIYLTYGKVRDMDFVIIDWRPPLK